MSSRIIDDPTLLNELVHRFVFGQAFEPNETNEVAVAIDERRVSNWTVSGDLLVGEYRWNGTTHKVDVPVGTFVDVRAMTLWTNRHGKPYQADIEAHVAAYRGHIPDYVGDAAWLAKGIANLVEDHEVKFERGRVTVDGVGWDIDPKTVEHADLSIAFWNAAIRAFGWSEDAHLNVSVRPANDN